MVKSLKNRLFIIAGEIPEDVISGKVKKFIENIFDEDEINWNTFVKERNLLLSNNRGFNPAIRGEIISVLIEGGVLSLRKCGNYEVSIYSASGLGEENPFYNPMGQELFFAREKDALGFGRAFEENEKKEVTIYFIQEVKR